MNCPACNRNLASTLSVCPSCGTMVHDSVREELALKITPLGKQPKAESPKIEITKVDFNEKPVPQLYIPPAIQSKPVQPKPAESVQSAPPPIVNPPVLNKPLNEMPIKPRVIQRPVMADIPNQPLVNKPLTSEIKIKNTAPTLVEFHNKNATLPEWRLQLQNTIRLRNERNRTDNAVSSETNNTPPRLTNLVTNGATALKAEPVENVEPVIVRNPIVDSNPTLANAMKRIEASRQKFFVEEIQPVAEITPAPAPAPKTFPYAVPNKPAEAVSINNDVETISTFVSKPQFADTINENRAKFDTNKLPPLSPEIAVNIDKPAITIMKVDLNIEEDNFLEIHTTNAPDVVAYADGQVLELPVEPSIELDEEDDCAPFSLRFNSAIFDLIIGAFASLILLAPIMAISGKIFSIEGLFAFLATCSIVMFIYLTTTIGLLGRTFGMKLFSLEIVDIDENAYPTFHQAAVSSAVYLLSLALGGLGFLTLLLNSEKRAAHDLVSGTIIVREYQS